MGGMMGMMGMGGGRGNRIREGGAVTTIAGDLGSKWVVHAVGPIYGPPEGWEQDDATLRSAYSTALHEAAATGCETVGFSLLSAGIFRGARPPEGGLNAPAHGMLLLLLLLHTETHGGRDQRQIPSLLFHMVLLLQEVLRIGCEAIRDSECAIKEVLACV